MQRLLRDRIRGDNFCFSAFSAISVPGAKERYEKSTQSSEYARADRIPSGDLKSDCLSLLRLGRTTKEKVLSSIRQICSNRGISTFLSAYKDYANKASTKEHVKYNKTHVESLTQALRFSKMDAGRLVRRQGDAST